MDEWDISYGNGGWSWTTSGAMRCQVTIFSRNGRWSVVCTLLRNGRQQRALYGGWVEGEAGLRACLVWAEQYLANVGEPPFDAVEARECMQ